MQGQRTVVNMRFLEHNALLATLYYKVPSRVVRAHGFVGIDHPVPRYKLPLKCKVVSREVFRALQRVGADGKYKQGEDMLRIRVPRRPRMEDAMPRVSIRQAMKKKPKPKPKPKPRVMPKPKRPRTPPRKPGPRKGECTICLKPSCMHLNMSRRLGAPLMW